MFWLVSVNQDAGRPEVPMKHCSVAKQCVVLMSFVLMSFVRKRYEKSLRATCNDD